MTANAHGVSPRPTVGLHRIRRGLDLPIVGTPSSSLEDAASTSEVGLLVEDFVGIKPRVLVEAGARVEAGQPLLACRDTPELVFGAPASGEVSEVHRGERRKPLSIVIRVDEAEPRRRASETPVEDLSPEALRAELVASGLWSGLRQRPFGRVPAPSASAPSSLFVTALDSHPLAPSIELILQGREAELEAGLVAVSRLTTGPTFLCQSPDLTLPLGRAKVRLESFAGPHPAGLPGLHIHQLDPVTRGKTVWHLGLQDVLAIGTWFTEGRLDNSRVISIGGPGARRPRHLRTRLGASLSSVTQGELLDGPQRVISGSVLGGRSATDPRTAFLGRYHQAISILPEGHERHFLGWIAPGVRRFSKVRAFVSNLLPKRPMPMTTSTNGSYRAIVPIDVYDRVMPMDIIPALLCRALLASDAERAEELGCLELCEDDVALLSFVCPGKNEYGPALREILGQIEKSL